MSNESAEQPTAIQRPSPFVGIPVSDYLRDGFALLLLLVSFAMPWNFASSTTGRLEVILITLLSVFSLSITYLARTGVFPPSVTVRSVWMLRLLANAPYVVLVLVYLIIDAASGANYVAGGLGYAAAFGLAGAILAAQPREAEVKTIDRGAAVSELWYRIVVVFGAVAALAGLVSLILILVRPGISFAPAISVVVVVASVLLNVAAIVLLYAGIAVRNEVGRLVAFAVGTVLLGAVLVDLFSRFSISGGGVESLHAAGFGVIVMSALAGLATAPPLRIAMNPSDPLQRWLRAASVLLVVIASIAAFIMFLTILALASGTLGSAFTAYGIGTIVIVVAIGLLAIVARTVLHNSPATSRTLVLGVTGLIFVLGIVHVVLGAVNTRIGVIDLVLAFGLPIAVAAFLSVPAAVRDYYRIDPASSTALPTGLPGAPMRRSFVEQLTEPIEPILTQRAAPQATAPVPSTSAVPTLAATAPIVSSIALALDPATPAETLFRLAQDEPAVRPYLAANPSTYGALLEWLGQLNDPAIDAALKARADG